MLKPFEKELLRFYVNNSCILFDVISRNNYNLDHDHFERLERVTKVLLANEDDVSLNALVYNVYAVFSEYSKREDKNLHYYRILSEIVKQLKEKYNVSYN